MSKFMKLSRAEMRDVFGGTYGGGPIEPGETGGDGGGTCSVEVSCADSTKVSCSGAGGHCHKNADSVFSKGWVQCDNDAKVYC